MSTSKAMELSYVLVRLDKAKKDFIIVENGDELIIANRKVVIFIENLTEDEMRNILSVNSRFVYDRADKTLVISGFEEYKVLEPRKEEIILNAKDIEDAALIASVFINDIKSYGLMSLEKKTMRISPESDDEIELFAYITGK